MTRRPDVAEAEQNIVAFNAQVGVATADFYPTFTLTGTAGFESVSAGSLFNASSRLWAVGPSIHIPIFEGGQLRGELRRSKAEYEETVANYRQNVLGIHESSDKALKIMLAATLMAIIMIAWCAVIIGLRLPLSGSVKVLVWTTVGLCLVRAIPALATGWRYIFFAEST